ncbi:hypothetical protein GOODEAATRI_013967, partial [Goodea atripinnis]
SSEAWHKEVKLTHINTNRDSHLNPLLQRFLLPSKPCLVSWRRGEEKLGRELTGGRWGCWLYSGSAPPLSVCRIRAERRTPAGPGPAEWTNAMQRALSLSMAAPACHPHLTVTGRREGVVVSPHLLHSKAAGHVYPHAAAE